MEFFADPSNNGLIQPLITLGVTIITAITALFIAFRAYAWQKALDREQELQRERRVIYRDFAASYRGLVDKLKADGDTFHIADNIEIFERSVAELFVSAPDAVADRAFALRLGVSNLITAIDEGDPAESQWLLFGACENSFLKCLVTMRKDSFKDTLLSSDLIENVRNNRIIP